MTERRDDDHRDDAEDPVGPFHSWRALYVAVIAYTAGLIFLLYLATRLLDFGMP